MSMHEEHDFPVQTTQHHINTVSSLTGLHKRRQTTHKATAIDGDNATRYRRRAFTSNDRRNRAAGGRQHVRSAIASR